MDALLVEYREAVGTAQGALDAMEPWQATPALGRAVESLKALEVMVAENGDGSSEGAATSQMEWFLSERLPLVQEALLRSAGVVVDVRLEEEFLVPGESANGVVELWNGGPFDLEQVSGSMLVPEGWKVQWGVDGVVPSEVPSGGLARWRFQLELPEGAEPSRLYYMEEPRDGELYRWPREAAFWGRPGNPDLLHGHMSLNLAGSTDVTIEVPAHFRGVDKAIGEYVEPVQVIPALSVAMDPPLMTWPQGALGSREFTVTVTNHAGGTRTGDVSLGAPEGWGVVPASHAFTLSETGSQASFAFQVTRPSGGEEGVYALAARARTQEGIEFGEGFTLVDENISRHCRQYFENAYYKPEPRIELAARTAELMSSCIDISDGLLGDLGHIIESSAVGAELSVNLLPLSDSAHCCVSERNQLLAALYGGDDYELCCTVPANLCEQFEEQARQLATAVTCIGEITAGSDIVCMDESGVPLPFKASSYQHFQSEPHEQ